MTLHEPVPGQVWVRTDGKLRGMRVRIDGGCRGHRGTVDCVHFTRVTHQGRFRQEYLERTWFKSHFRPEGEGEEGA